VQSPNDLYELLGLSRDAPSSSIDALSISSVNLNVVPNQAAGYDLSSVIEAMKHPSKRALYDSWLRTSPNKGIGFLNTNLRGLDDDFAVIEAIHRIDEINSQKRLMARISAVSATLVIFVVLIFFMANSLLSYVFVFFGALLLAGFSFGAFKAKSRLERQSSFLNWQITEGHFGR
jgi:hypothetical protein